MWVHWDDETGKMLGTVRHLPAHLEGRDASQLNLLGYRELVRREPEDAIARFPGLLGNPVFELMADGRVLQTFPEADFSTARVRAELTMEMKRQANTELQSTDWYVLRQIELGVEIPPAVSALRQKIRDHVEWLEQDIAAKSPRALVEYRWSFPRRLEETMVEGVPVVIVPTKPAELPPTDVPPDPVMPESGEALGVFGNSDPNVVDPAPPPPPEPKRPEPPATTDGPIPVWDEATGAPEFFDPNGIPLVSVYAPRVDDIGPRPDNN